MTALRISDAESQVMAAVWAGAAEILEAVGPQSGWGESTVRTLIHRLIRKGALKSERRREDLERLRRLVAELDADEDD